MKKILALSVALIMLLSLSACKKEAEPEVFEGVYRLSSVTVGEETSTPNYEVRIAFTGDGQCVLTDGGETFKGTYEKTGDSVRALITMNAGYKESWLMTVDGDSLTYEKDEAEYDDDLNETGEIVHVIYKYEKV